MLGGYHRGFLIGAVFDALIPTHKRLPGVVIQDVAIYKRFFSALAPFGDDTDEVSW